MSWYAVYAPATGLAVSFTSQEPSDLPAGLAYVVIDDQPGKGQAWDAASLAVVTYTPVPSDPSGALYELPIDGAWRWAYAVGPYRFAAKAVGIRSAQPTDVAAQAYIRANASVDDIAAAIDWATARRDSLSAALTAAGQTPAQNATYQAADAVIAFLGGCL